MLTTWALPQVVSYLGRTGGDPEDLRCSSSPLKRSANACATSAVPKQDTVKSRPSCPRRYVVARRPAPSRARRWACCSRRHVGPRPATRPDVATAGRAGFGWSCLLTSSRDFVPPHGDQLLHVRPKLDGRGLDRLASIGCDDPADPSGSCHFDYYLVPRRPITPPSAVRAAASLPRRAAHAAV
jgi:hypothetical protein